MKRARPEFAPDDDDDDECSSPLAPDLLRELSPVMAQTMDAPTLHAIRRCCKAFYTVYTIELQQQINWFAEHLREPHKALIFRALSPPSPVKKKTKLPNLELSILVAGYVKQQRYTANEIFAALQDSAVEAAHDSDSDDYDDDRRKPSQRRIRRAIVRECMIQKQSDAIRQLAPVDLKIQVRDVIQWLSIRHGGIALLNRPYFVSRASDFGWENQSWPILFVETKETLFGQICVRNILEAHYADHVLLEYAAKDPMKQWAETLAVFPEATIPHDFDMGQIKQAVFERHPTWLLHLLKTFAQKPGAGFVYVDPDVVVMHWNDFALYNPPVEWDDFLRYIFDVFVLKERKEFIASFARIPWSEANARIIRNIFAERFVTYIEHTSRLPSPGLQASAKILIDANLVGERLVGPYRRKWFLEALMKESEIASLLPTKIEAATLLALPDSPRMVQILEAYGSSVVQ